MVRYRLEFLNRDKDERLFIILSGGRPNYYRNSYNGPEVTNRERHLEHATFESGMAARHDANDDDNYSQARDFYQVKDLLSERERLSSCCAVTVLESTG